MDAPEAASTVIALGKARLILSILENPKGISMMYLLRRFMYSMPDTSRLIPKPTRLQRLSNDFREEPQINAWEK